jgi:hypothetical protein
LHCTGLLATGREPVATQTDPVATGSKPVATQTDSVATQTEPVATGHNPVATRTITVAIERVGAFSIQNAPRCIITKHYICTHVLFYTLGAVTPN